MLDRVPMTEGVSLLFIALLVLPNAQAQTTSVTPASITTCAPITMLVSGNMPCANQTFDNIVSSLLGNDLNIELYFTQPPICLPAILPFMQSVNVGILPPGGYTVTTKRHENGVVTDVLNTTLTVSMPIVDTAVTQVGGTLMASQQASAWQWLDCGNGGTAIPNANNLTFTPGVTGSYAVVVTMNGCMDTSGCVQVIVTGLSEYSNGSRSQVHPNPTSGLVNITFGEDVPGRTVVRIMDISARVVQHVTVQEQRVQLDLSTLPSGTYVIEVQRRDIVERISLVRE